MIRFLDVEAARLGPFVEGLRRLEEGIRYPVDGDTFTIDHGAKYHPFFAAMGDAHFLLAVDGREVVGSLAGVVRRAACDGRFIPSVYLADFKVAQRLRGQGLARQMLFAGVKILAGEPRLQRFRLLYAAAMRGQRGDVVTQTVSGFHPGQIVRPLATLSVYFQPPEKLAALSTRDAPATPTATGLDLSPEVREAVVSTTGSKDLTLASTGKPWPLLHLPLGPSRWGVSHASHLATTAASILGSKRLGTCCFALDHRLVPESSFLERQDVRPGATCTVYGVHLSLTPPSPAWTHLATSEI